SFYPIHEELHSQERTESPDKELNQKMRRLAIGISGMFTLLESLGINYRSNESLNRFKTTVSTIMSHMYFNLIFESCRMAIEEFKISGERSHDFNFQFDMRDSYRESILNSEHISDRYKHLILKYDSDIDIYEPVILSKDHLYILDGDVVDTWDKLKSKIQIYGCYNSLLTSMMPTATSSRIIGCSESFDPLYSNIYTNISGKNKIMRINKSLKSKLLEMNI